MKFQLLPEKGTAGQVRRKKPVNYESSEEISTDGFAFCFWNPNLIETSPYQLSTQRILRILRNNSESLSNHRHNLATPDLKPDDKGSYQNR